MVHSGPNLTPQQRYRAKHRERLNAKSLERYYAKHDENKAKNRQFMAKYRKQEPEAWAQTNRKYILKKKYGLTLDKFNAMVAAQGGYCAICQIAAATCVDHDHMSGEVRQILCSRCNSSLGLMDEVPARLRAAATYLEAHDTDYVDYSI